MYGEDEIDFARLIKNASALLPHCARCEVSSIMRSFDPLCLSMRNSAPVEYCVAEVFNL